MLGSPARVHAADNPQKAKELFQQGTTFFDLGQFDKAIDAWQAGYRERPDAGFLYNIAQAYRLAGDANKAIFFYKGYLRNAPKAHNRPEVEEKIAALQQKLDQDHAAGKPAAPPPAATAAPAATPPGPATASPPAAPAPPPPAPTPQRSTIAENVQPSLTVAPTEPPPMPPPPVTPPAETPTVSAAAPGPQGEALPRLDLGVALGFDGWGNSLQGKADPSFAFTLSAGYFVFQSGLRHPVQLRLGAAFGYTFLQEDTGKDTFVSGLVVPAIFVGLSPKVSMFGELGIGVLGIYGLKGGSPLLVKKPNTMVNGGQGLFEVRPALGAQVQITRAVGIFGVLAVDYSPKKAGFYSEISRSELLVGMSFRTLPR